MIKLFKLFLIFIHDLTAPLICDAFQWPATGQTTSYTDTFGEDSDYNNTLQSYTKLGIGGIELLDDATFKG